MSAKFTPGPWRVGGTGLYASVMGPDGRAIVSTGHSRRHPLECRANAHLLAAAPDLLEAAELGLKRMLSERQMLIESHCLRDDLGSPLIETMEPEVMPYVDDLSGEITFTEAAIRKARGES